MILNGKNSFYEFNGSDGDGDGNGDARLFKFEFEICMFHKAERSETYAVFVCVCTLCVLSVHSIGCKLKSFQNEN